MADSRARLDAITSNYDAFEAMLPLLMQQFRGRYVLMRHGEIAGVFDTAGAAQATGSSEFSDQLFSVQRVENKAIDLGFYSHARYRRGA